MAETFGSKLKQMRKDLASIVDRMNRERSYEVAQKAQEALLAVDELDRKFDRLWAGDEVPWDWQPTEDADG